ncbi:hypothetical protein R3Q06_12435 [Rhodococcus erythropolis]|uniref:YqaJ viral recombinase family protein n=1 Tax=Rhodococcus erythropolis TaxID=1833 RepID=UPI0029496059|nr:YqaJ viral recombinase family protein [Rhodococcus erythropolis]MDV6274311.1 hypothetical protein [Rhodococcus erythropolis]
MTTDLKPGSAGWMQTISPSKAAAITGDSPHMGALKLFNIWTGVHGPDAQTDVMKRGMFLEPGILNMYFDRHPELGRNGHETQFVDESLPFPNVANLDDLAHNPNGTRTNVQAKSDGHGGGFGKPGTDEIPVHYYVQVTLEMHIAKLLDTTMCVLNPFLQLDEYYIRYNQAHAERIVEACRKFYVDNILAGVPPEPDGLRSTYDSMRKVHPEIEADEEWEISPELAVRHSQALVGEKASVAEANTTRSLILKAMGKARRATCNGVVVAQRQPTGKGGVSLYPPRKPVDIETLIRKDEVA